MWGAVGERGSQRGLKGACDSNIDWGLTHDWDLCGSRARTVTVGGFARPGSRLLLLLQSSTALSFAGPEQRSNPDTAGTPARGPGRSKPGLRFSLSRPHRRSSIPSRVRIASIPSRVRILTRPGTPGCGFGCGFGPWAPACASIARTTSRAESAPGSCNRFRIMPEIA